MYKALLIAVVAALPAHAYADQIIYHRAVAEAYAPAVDEHDVTYTGVAAWDAVGKSSEVSAHSDSHPFDPPINDATSWSRYSQNGYDTGTYRAYSAVVGEYNAISNQPYTARTDFLASYHLVVTDPTSRFLSVSLIIPMHGLFVSRSPFQVVPIYSRAGASAAISVDGVQRYQGDLTVLGTDLGNGTSTYTASGDWVGSVLAKQLDVPFGGSQRTGYELSALTEVKAGNSLFATNRMEFDVVFAISTFASIPYASGTYSIADFSGTGGFEVIGRDASGNVVPVQVVAVSAVPEPGAWAILAGGALMVGLRRRGVLV